jgi:hypothetical protein
LSAVISLVWASLTRLSGEGEMSFEEALSLAAPTVEEEQKRAVLRALKDLEYERFVGKISGEDYEELSAQYRADARRLIALADDSLGERLELAQERLDRALSLAAERHQERSEKTSKVGGKKRGKKRRKRAARSPEEDSLTTTANATPRAHLRAEERRGEDETKPGDGSSTVERKAPDEPSTDAPEEEGDA